MTDVATHPFADETWSTALDRAVARYGADRTAFIAEGPNGRWHAPLTFGAWQRASRLVAQGMHALGVRPGDHIGVAAPGGPVWPVLQTACSHLGAVLLPINIRYRSDECEYILQLVRPRVVVALEALRENRIAEVLTSAIGDGDTRLVTFESSCLDFEPPLQLSPVARGRRLSWDEFLGIAATAPAVAPTGGADRPVLLQFTSGTTSFPKGALLGNSATLGVAYHLGERMGLDETDVLYGTQPFYHVGGSVGTALLPLARGTTVVVPERYTAEETFRLIAAHGCTARTGQGAMYAMELAHPAFDASTFDKMTKGWAGGTPELLRRIATDMGLDHLISLYGLTESSSTATSGSWDDDLDTRIDSCGRPLPGLDVGIFSDEGRRLEPDTVGEIRIRGWALMLGYLGEETDAIDDQGWLHTGDLGRIDTAGRLHFVDRLKDTIKPGGENVSPAEVERVLLSYEGVVRAAVVGRTDARLGEVPVAFVEPARGIPLDVERLLEHCRLSMAGFKVPAEVHLLDTWPMTESGKIQKRELRERLNDGRRSVVGRLG